MKDKIDIIVDKATKRDIPGILNTLKQNLIEIKDLTEISKKERSELEENGFLRKETDIEYFTKLIEDPDVEIYVAKNNLEKIIGFMSIYRKKYNIIKVRDAIGILSFENERIKDLLINENTEFAYLDQVSILPEYKRKRVATTIFRKALPLINTPIVAFIVEKPLFNKASIFWHKYNGFQFAGISTGEYKGTLFKFQIFIHWNN